MDAAFAPPQAAEVQDQPRPVVGGPHGRLAELVFHLTGCPAPLAVVAVERALEHGEPTTNDERLTVVARALLTVRRGIDLRDTTDLRTPIPEA